MAGASTLADFVKIERDASRGATVVLPFDLIGGGGDEGLVEWNALLVSPSAAGARPFQRARCDTCFMVGSGVRRGGGPCFGRCHVEAGEPDNGLSD